VRVSRLPREPGVIVEGFRLRPEPGEASPRRAWCLVTPSGCSRRPASTDIVSQLAEFTVLIDGSLVFIRSGRCHGGGRCRRQ
jgi:hypothetical protein